MMITSKYSGSICNIESAERSYFCGASDGTSSRLNGHDINSFRKEMELINEHLRFLVASYLEKGAQA